MPTPTSSDEIVARTYDALVSYQRADDALREELVTALEARGYTVFWDGKLGPDYWRVEWRNRLDQAKLLLVLWSKTAMQSPEVQVEAGGALQLKRCLSVPLDGKQHVPKPYLETNRHHWDRNGDPATRAAQLEAILAKVEQLTGGPSRPQATPTDAVIPVEFGDIPGAPPRLVGREAEMAMLRAAWESKPPKKINAVVLHALGGAGKSALLRTFASTLLAEGGGGAARIYGWSAYSQGSGEQKRADADSFISKALGDLGHKGEIPKDPMERARALARLIQQQRTLLLLDGLEPLQDPPALNKGRFKDKGLAELVKILARQNPGLMVLTTRQEVPELEGHGTLVTNHPLDELKPRAGADLLVELGVRGRQRELEAAVMDLEGHALSVTLLGTYLAEVCGGDIRHRDQFDFAKLQLTAAEQEEAATDKTIVPAKRAAKVMRGYLEQFEKLSKDGASAGLGGPERALLHLIGLFDRPADGPAIDKLLEAHIPGLTDELFFERVETTTGWLFKSHRIDLIEVPAEKRIARLREAKGRLRKLRLLSGAAKDDPRGLDAHPVVRAYFAGRLEETAPEAAKAAHDILYRHYAAAAPDLPDTLEEMQPLFHAVQHGVKAGRAQEAFDEIFWRRIDRGAAFLFRVLGGFGPLLTTLAHFFDPPWRIPCRDLTSADQVWLLTSAAFVPTGLGRLADSVPPRRAGLEACVRGADWANAASAGGELTGTLLTLGRISEAVPIAEASVRHADQAQDAKQQEYSRGHLGAALTAAGEFDNASVLFAEAEDLNLQFTPQWQYLASLQGFQYGDLLLALSRPEDGLVRGRFQLELAESYLGQGMGLLDIGLAHLLIGRAQDALGAADDAASSFEAAVVGLRKAGQAQFIPLALLARAAHLRRRAAAGETRLIEAIHTDLDEVADIAGDEMRMFLTDLALERARLALDIPAAVRKPEEGAVAQTALAARLIAETGYHRRDGELAELQARLAKLA
ncbi:MAG: TIR domain-containing protein [Hyphomicrobiales bacterium]|nr:TIR domain-containing protein [Hyphomicrobiales bacterium]